eukprot:scaffold115112_cov60-Cyclotella_meneghiniana.AAC.5
MNGNLRGNGCSDRGRPRRANRPPLSVIWMNAKRGDDAPVVRCGLLTMLWGFQKNFEPIHVAPRGDLDKCGKELFERMPELFLQRFEESFSEHTKKWRDRETLPVMIAAGHPLIVKWFCRWMFNNSVSIPSIEIDLYHYAGDQAMKIDLRECIEWLIEKVPADEYHRIQDDPLIQELINDLATVAQSEEEIDLLDPATWGDHDFSRAEALIWNAIAPRAAHQQRVENLVQTAAHLGQTHVEEARRPLPFLP